MQPTSRAVAVITDYTGLVTNTGPTTSDASKGEMAELTNLTPIRRGELAARPGYTVVQFDEES